MKKKSAGNYSTRLIKRSAKHVLLVVTAFLVTGFTALPQSEPAGDTDLRDRKLNLLEKLEKGIPVQQEEISSSFARKNAVHEEFSPFGDEFENLFENIRADMEKMHDHLDRIRDSREFERAMDSFRREREQLRLEVEKLREEMKKLRIEMIF